MARVQSQETRRKCTVVFSKGFILLVFLAGCLTMWLPATEAAATEKMPSSPCFGGHVATSWGEPPAHHIVIDPERAITSRATRSFNAGVLRIQATVAGTGTGPISSCTSLAPYDANSRSGAFP